MKELCPACRTLQLLYRVGSAQSGKFFFVEHKHENVLCTGSHKKLNV